jgi:hypothetical protein
MKIVAVCRQTVFTYWNKVLTDVVKGLLNPDWAGARKPTVWGAVAEEFRSDLSNRLAKVEGPSPDKPVRIWVLDEHRYGLLPIIRKVWARKGVRVHAPYETTYQWGYLHEALEVWMERIGWNCRSPRASIKMCMRCF